MSNALKMTLDQSIPLGQTTTYPKQYDKSLLCPVSRKLQRDAMGFNQEISFHGFDVWNAYELSWLNMNGRPVRALATIRVPCDSPCLAESKSVKLYLNSLNKKKFAKNMDVAALVADDLSQVCQAPVVVELNDSMGGEFFDPASAGYFCLDDIDIKVEHYQRTPELLQVVSQEIISEKLVSHLFKSHCLCTGQPDWGSIFIEYRGPKILRESLLAYLISYHDHSGFSENCIEQIFVDITKVVEPSMLRVFGRFTRRGGIDINPYRSSIADAPGNERLTFQ